MFYESFINFNWDLMHLSIKEFESFYYPRVILEKL